MLKAVLFVGLLLSVTASAEEPLELYWEDMVPPDYIQPEEFVSHDGSLTQQSLDAPVLQSLNGKTVRVPGFVVPLEGDGKLTSEFLLVPYFGACIHVPPPPPNQIVYVKFSPAVPIENLNDAVWVTGILSTQGWSGDIATVGYTMTGIKVDPYDG